MRWLVGPDGSMAERFSTQESGSPKRMANMLNLMYSGRYQLVSKIRRSNREQ